MSDPEVFIFCWYPDGWTPRAVIADISKFDDFMKNSMEKILPVGEIVENVREKYDCKYNQEGELTGFCSRSLGYRALNSDVIVDNAEIVKCFSTWEFYTDTLYRDLSRKKVIPEWIKFSSEYYINDANINLSPIKLHEKLKSLTCNPTNPKHKFIVKHCVLLSDIPLNVDEEVDVKPLRFFIKIKDNLELSSIKEKIEKALDVENVILSSGDYGFLTPKTIKIWEELNNASFETDFGFIIFS